MCNVNKYNKMKLKDKIPAITKNATTHVKS